MRKSILGALLVMGFSAAVQAADSDTAAEKIIRQQLMKVNANIPVESVAPADMPGLYEVVLGTGEILYADGKGEHFLAGQLYRLNDRDGFVNLTEQKLKTQRVALLAKVAPQDRISFKPKGQVKATISVFTDVDCPYCRKLHKEVPKLNAMGIQVDYLAFPRGGRRSQAYETMQSIWCADPSKRKQLLTEAKTGAAIPHKACNSPVMAEFELGQRVGVNGTPALVLADGTLVPGYMPAERLAQMLGVK